MTLNSDTEDAVGGRPGTVPDPAGLAHPDRKATAVTTRAATQRPRQRDDLTRRPVTAVVPTGLTGVPRRHGSAFHLTARLGAPATTPAAPPLTTTSAPGASTVAALPAGVGAASQAALAAVPEAAAVAAVPRPSAPAAPPLTAAPAARLGSRPAAPAEPAAPDDPPAGG
ncbi:MAG: hypothetical protein IRZ08_22125, partial [Frankia sp.]|nr:hypothetical protein [Frankia sp.]